MGTVYDALNKEQRELKRIASVVQLDVGLGTQVGGEESRWSDFLTRVDPHLIMHREADPAAVEQFKMLRTKLFFQRENSPRSLMIASTVAGEGKTLVAANLAVSLALGLTGEALLIDCDLRRPAISKLFGLPDKRGLADYLTRAESIEDLVVRTPLPGLLFLPSGGALHGSAPELLSSPRMATLFSELAGLFPDHRIICDCPPLSSGPDAAILGHYVDGALLVVMANETSREAAARSLTALGREKVLGVVFNGFTPPEKRRRTRLAA